MDRSCAIVGVVVLGVALAACGGSGPAKPTVGECELALQSTSRIAQSLKQFRESTGGGWPTAIPTHLIEDSKSRAAGVHDDMLRRLIEQSTKAQEAYNRGIASHDGWSVNFAMGTQSGNINQVLDVCESTIPADEVPRYRELEGVDSGGIDLPRPGR